MCAERRRFDDTPLAKVFTLTDELHLLNYRAKLSRLRAAIQGKQLQLLDAFRFFDTNRDGWLSKAEMLQAVESLGTGIAVCARGPQR